MNIFRPFCLLAVFIPAFAAQTPPSPALRFGITDACPHMCPGEKNAGFTVDIVRTVMTTRGYKVEFVDLPWARAAKMAREGELDGVLSAGKAETPYLVFPNQELALQQDCFFGRQGDTWQVTDAVSFVGRKSIVFSGWGNEAEYRKTLGHRVYRETFINFSIDADYIERVSNMVRRHRVDAFWMDPTVYDYAKVKRPQLLDHTFVQIGCVKDQKLYLALTPTKAVQSQILIDIFDTEMPTLRASGQLANILSRYGLRDWKAAE